MDSVVQADSDDAYVGRVFALYDTANNLCYVAAFALGVLLVPANGKGLGAVVAGRRGVPDHRHRLRTGDGQAPTAAGPEQ